MPAPCYFRIPISERGQRAVPSTLTFRHCIHPFQRYFRHTIWQAQCFCQGTEIIVQIFSGQHGYNAVQICVSNFPG